MKPKYIVTEDINKGELVKINIEKGTAQLFRESEPEKEEMVDHPKHYNSHPSGIECIEVIRHHSFNIGSAIKYLWRAGLKTGENPVQDLEKAVWYIQDEIKLLQKKG